MSDDDKAYFYRRAEEEIGLAQRSDAEGSVSFHYRLAALYLDKVFGSEGDPRQGLSLG